MKSALSLVDYPFNSPHSIFKKLAPEAQVMDYLVAGNSDHQYVKAELNEAFFKREGTIKSVASGVPSIVVEEVNKIEEILRWFASQTFPLIGP